MTNRTTLKDLENRAKLVNSIIEPLNIRIRRYSGYKHLELYDSKGNMLEHIRGGTSGEMYEYMGAMIKMSSILEKSKKIK